MFVSVYRNYGNYSYLLTKNCYLVNFVHFSWNCKDFFTTQTNNFILILLSSFTVQYTLNANMADHSVGAQDKLHESEASEASVFCFDNASPEKSCFMDGLVCFISLCLWVFELLNATRRDWNLPQERKSFFQFPRSPPRRRQTK